MSPITIRWYPTESGPNWNLSSFWIGCLVEGNGGIVDDTGGLVTANGSLDVATVDVGTGSGFVGTEDVTTGGVGVVIGNLLTSGIVLGTGTIEERVLVVWTGSGGVTGAGPRVGATAGSNGVVETTTVGRKVAWVGNRGDFGRLLLPVSLFGSNPDT